MDPILFEKLRVITAEEQEILDGRRDIDRDLYMQEQGSTINSRKLLDEVYLTQAMIECADRAGLVEEWMHTFDPGDKLWHTITRTLRRQIREQKQTERN